MTACRLCPGAVFPAMLFVVLVAGPAHADYDMGVAARAAGDYHVALLTLEAALTSGDPRAAIALGEMYDKGEGVAASPAKACSYFQKAADAGLAEGDYRVGLCYRDGALQGGGAAAVDWLQRAAAGGYAAADCAIGELYLTGTGVEQAAATGLAYCVKGARAGDVAAMEKVAELYWNGEGTPADPGQAATWLASAAKAGSAKSAWTLGQRYADGDGLPVDLGQANTYLRMAFEHGKLAAAATLAEMLAPLVTAEDGTVDQRIGTAALFWAGLASHVDESAEQRTRSAALYDELAAQAPSLVPRARAMLDDWLAAHPSLDRAS